MASPPEDILPSTMFLSDVEDEKTGELMQTISLSRSPLALLSFAANRFTGAASAYFQEQNDLGSVDWRMLFMLAQQPGITAARASETIVVDKGSVSRCLHRLAKNDLAYAGELHANGRSRGWYLTDSGRKMHDKILHVALEKQQQLLQGFAPAEVDQLCTLIQRFLENLEAVESEPDDGF
ncbi:MarR family transcriptional regulator [Parasphingorhabdus sp.]|uniref:MarR family winged helix-turn-helix transcriptional regulator n=1 Tax=Parasphingorhabdus sp. TaxID=2709688 RepID=UPI0032658967